MSNGIEFFKGTDGQQYFRVKAANGKTVAQSEGYKGERNARRGADALIRTLTETGTSAETIAEFVMVYGEQLHPTAVASSYLVIAEDRRLLFNLLEKATADGWTLIPPPPTEDPDK